MSQIVRNVALFGAAVLLNISAGVHAAVVANFESPTYTAGTDIGGVDGWVKHSGDGRVTPDANSGYVPPTYPILQGSQSFVQYGTGFYGRGWGSASSAVADGSTLSALVRHEINASSGVSGLYMSDNAGLGGGGSPAGVEFNHASDTIDLFGSGGSTSSGYAFANATTYLVEMVLDFTTDSFQAYATDLTNAGPRTSLGSKSFASAEDASTVAADGGVLILRAGSAVFWDAIEVNAIPEPALGGLLAMAATALLRRKSR